MKFSACRSFEATTVTLPTELRGRTEKVGDDYCHESRRRLKAFSETWSWDTKLKIILSNYVTSLYFRHFQKPGSNITLSEVSNWAKRPFPQQDVFVIGDPYNPYRGWTQGAIMSADNALLEGWQIQEKSSSQKKYNLAVSLSELVRDPSRDLQNH